MLFAVGGIYSAGSILGNYLDSLDQQPTAYVRTTNEPQDLAFHTIEQKVYWLRSDNDIIRQSLGDTTGDSRREIFHDNGKSDVKSSFVVLVFAVVVVVFGGGGGVVAVVVGGGGGVAM